MGMDGSSTEKDMLSARLGNAEEEGPVVCALRFYAKPAFVGSNLKINIRSHFSSVRY